MFPSFEVVQVVWYDHTSGEAALEAAEAKEAKEAGEEREEAEEEVEKAEDIDGDINRNIIKDLPETDESIQYIY